MKTRDSLATRASKIVLAAVLALSCVSTTAAHADGCIQWEEGSGAWKYGSKGWWYQLNSYQFAIGQWDINGKSYYFDNNGWMQTGWIKRSNNWYYYKSSGAAATNWQKIKGVWYYFDSYGRMVTGWNQVGGTWYYHNKSGAMLTGWQYIGKKWYFFNKSGAMAADAQVGDYYLTSNGSMATNRWIGNRYFQKDGRLATSQWIGKYHVNENGLWDASRNAIFGNKYYDANSKEVVFSGRRAGSLSNSEGRFDDHTPANSTMSLDIKSYDASTNTYTADITVMIHFCYGMTFAPATAEELLACDRICTFSNVSIDQKSLLNGGTLWNGTASYEEETEEGSRASYMHNFTITSSSFDPKNCTVNLNFVYDLSCSEHVDTYTVKLV